MRAWILLAALLRAEVTEPVRDLEGRPAEPKKSVAAQWSDLYRMLDEFKASNTDSGPVSVYDLDTDAKLPAKIFIAAYPTHKVILTGLLDALEVDWKKRYWVADKAEATAKIVKALKIKEKEEVERIRKRIDTEMGSSYFLVYRVNRPVEGEVEEDEGVIEPSPAPAPPKRPPAPPPVPKSKPAP